MVVFIWTVLAVIGVALLVVPRQTVAEVGRVARTINDKNPGLGEILLRLIGLALFTFYGLAITDRTGLTN